MPAHAASRAAWIWLLTTCLLALLLRAQLPAGSQDSTGDSASTPALRQAAAAPAAEPVAAQPDRATPEHQPAEAQLSPQPEDYAVGDLAEANSDYWRDARVVAVRREPAPTDVGVRRRRLIERPAGRPALILVDEVLSSGLAGQRKLMVGDELLVKPAAGKNAELSDLNQQLSAELLRPIGDNGLQLVRLPVRTIEAYDQALAAYRQAAATVAYADPNYIRRVRSTPNDPNYATQWHLNNLGLLGGKIDADIDAPEAWDIASDASSVIVAVIDTGVEYYHSDLSANIWTNPGETAGNSKDDDNNGYKDDVHGWNFVDNDAIPDDYNGHGTHVAGIIGAVGNNSVGVCGVCWKVKIMPVRVGDADGNITVDAELSGIAYAVANGASILNLSLGADEYIASEKDSLTAAAAKGALIVCAAGNDGRNTDTHPEYPACYTIDAIISVANSNRQDLLDSSSNYGAASVDLAAPGTVIYSTYMGGSYSTLTGTSMATPMVVGACALLKAAQPSLTAAQLKAQVLAKTDALTALSGKCVSGGRLNLYTLLGGGPVTLSAGTPLAHEGTESAATLTVTRIGSTGGLTINLTLSGTATAGSDYQSFTSVTIPDGSSSATISIVPIDDTESEGNETVTVTLTSGTGYSLGGTYSGTVTIVDNDDAVAQFVSHFYTYCLNRSPDESGYYEWCYDLHTGARSGAAVGEGFVLSDEFKARGTSNSEFTSILYNAFFNREPSAGESSAWVAQLDSGVLRADVLNGFIFAQEFVNWCGTYGITAYTESDLQRKNVRDFVRRFYQQCLEREPDEDGIIGWMNALLAQTSTGGDVGRGFVLSDEFVARNLDNAAFLTVLYHAFFNREPDSAGLAAWQTQLAGGTSRATVLNGFIYSTEFSNLAASYGIKAY